MTDSAPSRTLLVEGWRSICHSYAVANQWQLLALMRRSDVALSIRDVPFFNPAWRRVEGLFDAAQEAALAALPLADARARPAATFRISFPYNVAPAPHGRTAVWGTAEVGVIPPNYLTGPGDIKNLAHDERFMAVAPSRWSAQGFLRLGLRPEQVALVPLGVDTKLYRPDAESRAVARRELRLDGFVFLTVGAMTPNKGMDVLLRAFARVVQKKPGVRLVLKGADDLYNSRALLQSCLPNIPAADRNAIADRLIYLGNTFSMQRMAALYRAADAYVSPYRAEGFNMPVLEAAASGLPVICTAGGSTDDFVVDAFARRIRSTPAPLNFGDGLVGTQLEPDLDHLTELMFDTIDNSAWRRAAAAEGPRHAAANYDWNVVAQQLLDALFGKAGQGTFAPVIRAPGGS